MVKTKIIATLGPSTDNKSIFRKMIAYGLDMVRLNFSHGRRAEHIERIRLTRELNTKLRRGIKLMQDLEGYRIRIGRLNKEIFLKNNAIVYLIQEDFLGNEKEIPFDYRDSLSRIKKNSLIYIDDGRITLKVRGRDRRRLKTQVVSGGFLKERKGMNIPGAELSFPSSTEKDKRDVELAVKYKLDCVAQSFVRCAKDISLLKDIVSCSAIEIT